VALAAPFFRGLATALMFVLLLAWIANAALTLAGVASGAVFGVPGGWRGRGPPLLPAAGRTGEDGTGRGAEMRGTPASASASAHDTSAQASR
jgi:hypothetical protein